MVTLAKYVNKHGGYLLVSSNVNGLWKSFWVKSESWKVKSRLYISWLFCPVNMVVILTWANTASRLQLILYS